MLSVVITTYNVEDYIEDLLESLDRQNGRISNLVKIIFVDDESTDNTSKLIDQWENPNNYTITRIVQENSGPGAARNNGLQMVKNGWVTFIDGDDIISDNYFASILTSLLENPDVSLVQTRILRYLEAKKEVRDDHPLKYKFRDGNRIIDLRNASHHFQLSSVTAIFNMNYILVNDIKFDETLQIFEDAKFISEYLIKSDNNRILILASAQYIYRRRSANNSLVPTAQLGTQRYLDVPEYAYIYLIDLSISKYGFVPEWLQNLILYDIFWTFKLDEGMDAPARALDFEVNAKFISKVRHVLKYIENHNILYPRAVRFSEKFKSTFLALKNDYSITNNVLVDRLDPKRQLMRVRFYSPLDKSPIISVNHCGEVYELVHKKIRSIYFFKHHILNEFIFWIPASMESTISIDGARVTFHRGSYPEAISEMHEWVSWSYFSPNSKRPSSLNADNKLDINLITERNYKPRYHNGFGSQFRDNSPKNEALDSNKTTLGISANPSAFSGTSNKKRKQPALIKRNNYSNFREYFYYSTRNRLSLNSRLSIPPFIRRSYKNLLIGTTSPNETNSKMSSTNTTVFSTQQPQLPPSILSRVWLFMDRLASANDNAEHLYRYALKNYPEIDAWFVLDSKSTDWVRLQKEGFKLVSPKSKKHVELLNKTEAVISSHADHPVITQYSQKIYDKNRWRFVFLQHGITKDDLSRWLNGKRIDLFLTSSRDEFASITSNGSNYDLTTKEVVLTGFPRHDRLISLSNRTNIDKNVLLIAPTWRREEVLPLRESLLSGDLDVKLPHDSFWSNWDQFLRSSSIANLIDSGTEVVLLPHPDIAKFIPKTDELTDLGITIASYSDDVQEILSRTYLVVSDYSSIVFDLAVINVPSVYFQFDQDSFFRGNHVYDPGYFNYNVNGFGPVFDNLDDLVVFIHATNNDSSSIFKEYSTRFEAFEYRDTNNCDRSIKSIFSILECD